MENIPKTAAEFRAKVWSDPEWYVKEILGVRYWSKQIDILESIRDNRRTSCSGCTGSSKTFAMAMGFFWWLSAFRPSRVFTFAPGSRQVRMNLWGYIREIYYSSKKPLGGKLFQTSEFRVDDRLNWYGKGFSTKEPEMVKGIHGKNDLIVLDDAQGIPDEMSMALENAMANGSARLVVLFNQIKLSGMAYETRHSKRHLYNVISIPASETPNVKSGQVIIPGMITADQVAEWVREFGKDSNFYRPMVLDQEPSQETDTLIPMSWCELAAQRDLKPSGEMVLGEDVAGPGEDRSVIVPMKGRVVFSPQVYRFEDTMALVGETIVQVDRMNAKAVFADIIGIGNGVVNRLREQDSPIYGVDVSESSTVPKDSQNPKRGKKFANLRAEIWWLMRESLDPQNPDAIQLPNDPELFAELSAPHWSYNSRGEIIIEPKEAIKKILGRSPDKADAVCLAVYGQHYRIKTKTATGVTVVTCDDDDDE